jgi:isoquinoline 1-oxidoreductase beta subunit
MSALKSAVEQSAVSRRAFLKLAAAGGVAVVFGLDAEGRVIGTLDAAAPASGFSPNQWVRIDQRGRVTIRAHKSEMGQGVRTALPAIVAAELGVAWSQVRVEHAEPGPDFADMGTSGSGSVSDSWRMLRAAAATARVVLVSAAATRWRVSPSECDTVDGAVVHRATNRTRSFASLVADAARIPIPTDAPLRPDAGLPIIGTRLKRVDTPAIVRGRATYGIDVRLPNMRIAVIARPPVRGATPTHWNEAVARRVDGVESVVQTPSGIAVVARNTWAATRGRLALGVEWSSKGDANQSSTAFLARLEAALDSGKKARREGDVAAAFNGAATHLDATYRSPFQAHAAMEPLNCVADVRSDKCEIWVGTQRPNGVKALAATLLGIPEDHVTVHVTLIGGAFGRRIAIDHVRETIELSRAIKGPVQVVWTREDDFAHDWYGAAQVNRLSAALDAAGNVIGWRHQVADHHLTMFGTFDPNYDPAADGDPWGGYDTPYAFPALDVTLAVLDPPVPTGAWRSVAYPAAVFARECFLDEVAHATKRDPLDLRLSLIASPGMQGTGDRARPNGDRLRNVLRLAAARANWGQPFAESSDGRRYGRGIACNPYHRGAMVAQVAEVSVGSREDIRVHRIVTAIDVGRVIDRSGLEAQVEGGVGWALSAALKTEITFANGQAEQNNFNTFPVLRMREMPAQEIIVVESALGPFGAGEPPVPAVYAAVGNAIFAATGKRLRQTPFRFQDAS